MRSIPLALCCALLVLTGAAQAASDAPPSPARLDADGVQRVTLVGGSYFFRPERVSARAGQPLEITLQLEPGIVPHRFVLEGPDGKPLAEVAMGSEPKTLRLTLPAGDYPFFCPNRLLGFKSHRERGMAGVLEVRE